jgi:uncharacterized membrane protein YbhN (UPF0104 family)
MMCVPKAPKIVVFVVASLVFVASVGYLVKHFELREAFTSLLEANFPKLIVLLSTSHFAFILVRACRWRSAVRHANSHVTFFDFYWITAVVVSLSILTPGQLGEGLKIELMKRRGLVGRLPGLGAFALERVLDLLVVVGMGATGLVFSGLAKSYRGLVMGAAILIILGLISLYILLLFNPGGRTSLWLARMRTGSGSPATWAVMSILTVCSWTLVGVSWQIALFAVGIQLSLPQVLSLLSLVTMGTLLSFIPGGLGVSEVIASAVLTNMGVASVTAQAGALILRAYALIIVLFGLTHLILWVLYNLPSRIWNHGSAS